MNFHEQELEAVVAVVAQESQAGLSRLSYCHHRFHGPSADLTTKIVVAIVRDEGREPDPLERWFSEDTDVRTNPAVGEKVLVFLKEHAAKSVIVTDGLIGCW
ncbi:MAG TPA: hypothetical protein VK937_06435 [Candidatus Limnocylindria bacterium]|nr:hypothetical protein [Candidatus Limnocylindria bacterium]